MRVLFTYLIFTSGLIKTIYCQQTIFESMGNSGGTLAISTHESNNGFDNVNLTYSGSADLRTTVPSSGSGLSNILFNNNGEDFIIGGLSTNSQVQTINVSFLLLKTTNTENGSSMLVEYSTNGSTFSGSVSPTLPTGTGTSNNYYSVSVNLSSVPSGIVAIRFRSNYGTNSFRLDDVSLSTTMGLLPVDFVFFNVYNKKISFSTASETNNDFFTIERSGDGRSFDAIGEIKGAGNSTEEKHYEFTDENPLPGINYYRIKQTDFDGQYSYSEIRSVRYTGKGNVAISPRSTDGRLDISTEMESYDVAVYSSAGQEVARFAALSGHQTVSIEALPAGIYFVKVMSGTESETVRVVKY